MHSLTYLQLKWIWSMTKKQVFQHDFKSSFPHCQISAVSQPKSKKKQNTCARYGWCDWEQHSFLTNNVVFKKRHITHSPHGSRYMTSSFTEYTHFLLAWLKEDVSFIKIPCSKCWKMRTLLRIMATSYITLPLWSGLKQARSFIAMDDNEKHLHHIHLLMEILAPLLL